jgi:hypothetical protein
MKKTTGKEFVPSMKKGKLRYSDGNQTNEKYDVPGGIIARLTRQCGGNVHGRKGVAGTSSGTANDKYPNSGAKNAANLATISCFDSADYDKQKHIRHTRNNCFYCDCNERIAPAYHAMTPS